MSDGWSTARDCQMVALPARCQRLSDLGRSSSPLTEHQTSGGPGEARRVPPLACVAIPSGPASGARVLLPRKFLLVPLGRLARNCRVLAACRLLSRVRATGSWRQKQVRFASFGKGMRRTS